MIYYFSSWLSWLDGYTDALQHFISAQTVLSPLLLLFVEEMGIPIIVPGDAILAYMGYKLSLPHNAHEFWPAIILAEIAVLSGATVLFFLSRRWGQQILDRLAKFAFVKDQHVRRAERLFVKYDVFAIIVGRHIPGLRIIVTVLAGSSGVRYLTFLGSTFISATIWILFFIYLGKRWGADFHDLVQHYAGLSIIAIVAVVAGIIALHFVGAYRITKKTQNSQAQRKNFK
ncbi:MAG: DedA family protein [Candidatus Saccharimonadales bacterium]